MSKGRQNGLLFAIFLGAAGGILSGWYFGTAMTAVGWIGQLFLDMLKMVILPLIIAAVINGASTLGDVRKIGKIGGLTLLYYFSTTTLAVLLGLILVNIIQPGVNVASIPEIDTAYAEAGREPVGFQAIIASIIRPNLFDAAVNNQLLPIIVFCLLFAVALSTIGDKNRPMLDFFAALNEVMMRLVGWLMYLAPLGIFALIASRFGQVGGGDAIMHELRSLAGYCMTVILGLTIHACLLFVLLLVLSPYGRSYLASLMRALFTAFGTASSSATLPLTMECAVEAGVDRRAANFVLPLGATVNMDGTALYEAVAVLFIAQMLNIPLGFGEQAIIFVTATLAAIGAAGIPQAGLVTMLIVLSAVNLPTEAVGLLLAVDWLLDRFRTMVNVWGDSVGAALIERVLLPRLDKSP